jgi:hypothetical protein
MDGLNTQHIGPQFNSYLVVGTCLLMHHKAASDEDSYDTDIPSKSPPKQKRRPARKSRNDAGAWDDDDIVEYETDGKDLGAESDFPAEAGSAEEYGSSTRKLNTLAMLTWLQIRGRKNTGSPLRGSMYKLWHYSLACKADVVSL